MKVIKYSNLLTPVIEIITALGISFAIFQASRTEIRLESFIPVIMALYMSYEPIKKLGAIQNQIKQALASIHRIEEILNADELVLDSKEPVSKRIKGDIEFKNVCYSYKENMEKALHNLNFTISSGEVIALVGPSGAGKTTIANLLPRFFDPVSGEIKLDGVSLSDYSLKNLRESIAIVPQKPFLFDLSVLGNIELGYSQYTDKEPTEAADLSNSTEFINNLPAKFQERLGEDGSRLSGGQIQRLAMARAFYKNAPILIMDEATSALDSENEEKIQESLKKLMKGKTTFLIAHRFSSIRLANRILVINKGEIIADGSHEVVYNSCDLYRSLYDQQTEDIN